MAFSVRRRDIPRARFGQVGSSLIDLLQLVIFAVAAFLSWLARRIAYSRTTHWPEALGTIQSYGEPQPPNSLCTIRYSYMVGGEHYSGETPIEKGGAIRDVNEVRNALGEGTTIQVRYNPKKPSVSVALIPEFLTRKLFE